MILTGPKIEHEIAKGGIVIDPSNTDLVGPNSVDLRLHPELKVYDVVEWPPGSNPYEAQPRHRHPPAARPCPAGILDTRTQPGTTSLHIPETGVILWPGVLYLGRTIETVGSDTYVPIVEGRSSVGRLGIRVHQTAGFCDLGFLGTITLEIDVLHPVRVYPGLPICQAYFLTPTGAERLYTGRYQGQVEATPSRIHV